jgi:hypothetical protein
MVASAHHNAHPRERDASAARGGHQRGGFQRGGGRGGRGGGRGGAFAGRPSSRNQPRASAGTPPAVDPSQVTSTDWGTEATNKDTNGSTGPSWGAPAEDAWGAEPSTGGGWDSAPAEPTPEPPAPAPVVPNGITKVTAPVPAPAKATPGVGAVRSWAQVARQVTVYFNGVKLIKLIWTKFPLDPRRNRNPLLLLSLQHKLKSQLLFLKLSRPNPNPSQNPRGSRPLGRSQQPPRRPYGMMNLPELRPMTNLKLKLKECRPRRSPRSPSSNSKSRRHPRKYLRRLWISRLPP